MALISSPKHKDLGGANVKVLPKGLKKIRKNHPAGANISTFTATYMGTHMEQELIDRAKKGDKSAFQHILTAHLPNVYNLATRMLADREEAQDVAQDVMLKLWNKLDDYDPKRAKLSSWLYRITANQCLDKLRRKRPDQLAETYDEATAASQEQELYEKQVSSCIKQHLAALPERQRLALILFHYQGVSIKEGAEIMQCSPDAMESLLSRARRTLKTKLQPVWQQMSEDNLE